MNEENKLPEEDLKVNNPQAAEPAAPVVVEDGDDNTKFMTEEQYEQAKLNQNLPVAVIAGLIAGIVCAGIWAGITVATHTIYSYMAILVGLGVGFVIRKAGRGVEMKFGIVGALIALLSCALGNFLATIGFVASSLDTNFFDILFNFDYSALPTIMANDFEPIDLLFYGLAVVTGFGASYQNVKVH